MASAPSTRPGPVPLDPRELARVAGLAVRARMVVEGVFSGIHQSPHHGSSVEFAEHKEYSPGDEVRHLDWRLFAKSDKLYVKRFEHETNLRATIVLDASGSMAYGDTGLSKWDYARVVAAVLIHLLLAQRDAVGLAIASGGEVRLVPARSDRGHFQALIAVLESAVAEGPGSMAASVDAIAERLPKRGMVFLLSDALEELSPLTAALKRLRHRRHDVSLLQILDPDELTLPFDELTMFKSMEDDRAVLVEPVATRRAYLEALNRHLQLLESECRAHAIDHAMFATSEPPDRSVVRFLAGRAGHVRG